VDGDFRFWREDDATLEPATKSTTGRSGHCHARRAIIRRIVLYGRERQIISPWLFGMKPVSNPSGDVEETMEEIT
jgi:hypothetical protein